MIPSAVLFPTVVVDDFFTDPDEVVKFGYSLELGDYTNGYLGWRTDNLNKTHPSFAKELMKKIFSVYFSDPSKISCEKPGLTFHLIPKFSENKEDSRYTGWVHKDRTVIRNKLSGVIYLTPNAQLDTGTCIVKVKKGCESYLVGYNNFDRNELPLSAWHVEHTGQKYVRSKQDLEKIAKDKEKWNGYFEPSIVVGNVYNRIILFDGNDFHCGNKYYQQGGGRFTLFFSFNNVKGDILPKRRVSKDNLTELINASTNGSVS